MEAPELEALQEAAFAAELDRKIAELSSKIATLKASGTVPFRASDDVRELRSLIAKKAAATKRANSRARFEKASKRAGGLLHLHPADDPWSRTCRTLCGKIVDVSFALSPKVGLTAFEQKHDACVECLALLRAWKISGNGKPLTFRRLNSWPTKNQEIDPVSKLIPRAAALKAAAEKTEPGSTVHTLLGELIVTEQYRATVEQTPQAAAHEAATRRALTVELVKAGLPKEILAELLKTA